MINGLPSWVKIVTAVGFPIAIALILLGVLIGFIPSPLMETQAIVKDNNKLLQGAEIVSQTSVKILRSICRNGAKSELTILECDR